MNSASARNPSGSIRYRRPRIRSVKAWQASPLEELYPVIYPGALVVKVRDGHQVRNKAAHIALGAGLDGIKHVLGIWVQAAEGAKFQSGAAGCATAVSATC
jgi:transposase-like protein